MGTSSICAFLIIQPCQFPSPNSLFTHTHAHAHTRTHTHTHTRARTHAHTHTHTHTHHRLMDRSDQIRQSWQWCPIWCLEVLFVQNDKDVKRSLHMSCLQFWKIGDSRAATSTVLLRLASGLAEVFPQSLSFPVICLSSPGKPTPSPWVFVQGTAQYGTPFFSPPFFHLPSSGLDFLCLIWSWHSLTVCRFAVQSKRIRKYMCCQKYCPRPHFITILYIYIYLSYNVLIRNNVACKPQ